MILKKIFFNLAKIILLLSFSLIAYKYGNCEKLFYTPKSLVGSILAGQIAKYNNENSLASEFYSYASKKEPANENLLNLSLMSLILAGKVEEAITTVNIKGNKSLLKKSEIANLLKFVNLIKNKNYDEASIILNKNKDLIYADKLLPIIKAWLSSDLKSAKIKIENFEYKTDGLVFSDLYFQHLAHINLYYNEKTNALNNFKKGLKNANTEKLRLLYFYYDFLKKYKLKDDDGFLVNFSKNFPDHSLNIYLNKNFNTNFSINNPIDGISEIFFNIAEALYGQGMHDSSIAYSYLSIYLNNKNFINYYLIAENFQMLNKNKKAISSLSKIALNSYVGWNSFLKIIDLEIAKGNFDNAQKYMNKLKKFSPKRKDLYYKLGELYHNKKQYETAINFFSNALSLINNPTKKDWYLYYSRGMSYERSKKWKNAENDFLLALELYPSQPLVLNYLGYTWIDLGINLEKAENFIEKAVKLRPNDGYFIDSLGWAYYRKGAYRKAVEELEKAVALVPNDPIINDHLGDALWRSGYKNEAIFQWNRALLYKPEVDLLENIKLKLRNGL